MADMIVEWAKANCGTAIVIGAIVLTSLIQIAPIKVNPWSALTKWIGKALNGDVVKELKSLQDDVSTLNKEVKKNANEMEKQNAVNCRVRILRFGDEIIHGVLHSKDSFDQTLQDITTYTNYCNEHPDFKNDMTALTSKRIEEAYEECMRKGTFL